MQGYRPFSRDKVCGVPSSGITLHGLHTVNLIKKLKTPSVNLLAASRRSE